MDSQRRLVTMALAALVGNGFSGSVLAQGTQIFREFLLHPRDRPPMAVSDQPDRFTIEKPKLGIINQIDSVTVCRYPALLRQDLGLLCMQLP